MSAATPPELRQRKADVSAPTSKAWHLIAFAGPFVQNLRPGARPPAPSPPRRPRVPVCALLTVCGPSPNVRRKRSVVRLGHGSVMRKRLTAHVCRGEPGTLPANPTLPSLGFGLPNGYPSIFWRCGRRCITFNAAVTLHVPREQKGKEPLQVCCLRPSLAEWAVFSFLSCVCVQTSLSSLKLAETTW